MWINGTSEPGNGSASEKPDQEQEPTERLPQSGLRVPVPEREDVMAAIRKVSEPEPGEDSDEKP